MVESKIKNFYYLTDDLLFKCVFSEEKFLKYFINLFFRFLNDNSEFAFTNITPEYFIKPEFKNIKGYYGDIVANLDNNNIVSLEMYKYPFTKEMFNKSFAYMSRLYSNQIKIKSKIDVTNYRNMHKVISINLIKGNYKKMNNNLVNKYIFGKDKGVEIIDSDNVVMYLIRIDLVTNMAYNEGEDKFITLLRLINARSVEEMAKYTKGDETMNEVMEYVTNWNNESSKYGIDRYLEELKNEVRKQTRLEDAKTLLLEKFDIEFISKVTNLSEEEIMELKMQNE